MPHVLGLMKHS